MPTIHLPYGGSTADRDINCPGNKIKCADIPPRPAGEAALDGSMKHEIMEICTSRMVKPETLLGHEYKEGGFTHVFDEEAFEQVERALAAQEDLFDDLEIDEFLVEPFVQYVVGKSGGSIDLLGLSDDRKTILVLDHKFGQVVVSPKESAQHGVYALASRVDPTTADMWKEVEHIVFAINQPRSRGCMATWETDLDWLNQFEETYKAAIEATHIHPGAHCKWCPAAAICEEKRLNVMGSNLLGTGVKAELQAAADVVIEVEDWVKAVKEELYMQINRGVAISGWKIINKRATRKWKDEGLLADALTNLVKKQDTYKQSLLTPPQMEKLLKSKKVDLDLTDFITAESSGTTLAEANDPSDAVLASDIQGHLNEVMK